MKVMVVGATGRYAHWIFTELVQRGVDVPALVRSEQAAKLARNHGAAEVVLGDLHDANSIAAAVADMEGFFIGPALWTTRPA